jgi:hypothetical protein
VAVGCVSRTVGQCKQEAQRCLTLRSSGAPTSRRTGHQAQGLRPILRLLSSAPRCWLPLTSNVRQHTQAVRFACISIQMQLLAAVGSIQIVVPSFCGIGQGRGQANHAYCYHRSAHVLRRSRVLPSLFPQPKSNDILPLVIHVSANSSQSSQVMWSSLEASPRKVVSHEAGFGLFRLFAWCREGRAVVGLRRLQGWLQQVACFPYSWSMQPRSAVLPNPSVKRSANIASRWPSSAGPAAHFALAVQHATLLATAYLKR